LIRKQSPLVCFDDWDGDGHEEKWAYQVDGDHMAITWPDGAQATFYRDGIKP